MDLIRFYLDEHRDLVLQVSLWVVAFVVVGTVGWMIWKSKKSGILGHFQIVKLNVTLGGIGAVELRPNVEDIQIAHKIWAELITRKAALPIDPEHDLIVEIYDSWYALFSRTRQLIGDIPGSLLRTEKSTQKLVKVTTDALNLGLRPHLTRWQARFRNWYAQHTEDLKTKTPQEVQRQFPEYSALIEDMKKVNEQLIQYASELEKIVHGG